MPKPVDIARSRQFVRSAGLPPRTCGAGDAGSVDEALQAG
jgi:hypothetical protein